MGLRVGEIINLKRTNFSSDWRVLTYIMEKSHKPHDRLVPNFLVQELKGYYLKYNWRMTDKYLFFANWDNQSTNPHLQRNTIGLFFQDMRRDLEMDQVYYVRKDGKELHRVSPHTLRHNFAFLVWEASGHDIKAVQELLGHSKAETTFKYINALQSKESELMIMEKAFAHY
jgi:integrase